MTIYKTIVTEVGSEAEQFKAEQMIILFGENVPDDLKAYTYRITRNPLEGSIEKGGSVSIGSEHYPITAVGNLVNKNLADLGHITIKFDGASVATLPGTLHVAADQMPVIAEETRIAIHKNH